MSEIDEQKPQEQELGDSELENVSGGLLPAVYPSQSQIISPRDTASGLPTGILSPRDPASGLPTGKKAG
jgi:hypothetical protein